MVLLSNDKTNQSRFGKFLFHIIEVAVGIEFAHKKNLFFTCFAHHKLILWESCGLGLSVPTADSIMLIYLQGLLCSRHRGQPGRRREVSDFQTQDESRDFPAGSFLQERYSPLSGCCRCCSRFSLLA